MRTVDTLCDSHHFGGANMVDQVSMNTDLSAVISQVATRPRVDAESPKAVAAKPEVSPTLSLEKMEQIVQVANATLESANNSLRFQVDDSVKAPIVTVVDQDSGEVIRQLPSEELVRIARSIESMRGVLFDAIT